MKKGFILISVIVIILIAGYFTLSFYAVQFAHVRLQKFERPGLKVAEIRSNLTHLSLKGIRFEEPSFKQNILAVEEIRIYPSLLSFLKGTLGIRECSIINPSLFFFRSKEGVWMGPWVSRENGKREMEGFIQIEKKKGEALPIQFDRIRIQKGSIDFIDGKIGENPARTEVRELDFEIKNIQYPMVSVHSSIELKGKMKGRTEERNIEIKGWIDPKTMDMEASFKFREVDIKTFEPYYRKRVSAEIESGYMNMETKVVLKKRVIDAPGELELVDLRVRGEGTVFWIPAKNLNALLKTKGDQMKLSFHIKGNMDDPRFSLHEIILTRIAISFLDALGIPIKIVGEEFLEDLGKDGEGWIEGLKSLKKLFKKRKEKKR